MIAAWQEENVIKDTLERLVRYVEYKNYIVFVGIYPNDERTQAALDEVTVCNPHVIKVLNLRPGPTTKAQNLNSLYRAVKHYEDEYAMDFDIIVVHDAEDAIHPYSLLLYNFLLPRVDAIQIPVLPLPLRLSCLPLGECLQNIRRSNVHWAYADEFAQTQQRDQPVREKISGFVPFSGVGFALSRRVFRTFEQIGGQDVYDEAALAEDYSFAKRLRETGFTFIFASVDLKSDQTHWWTPLCRRPTFISTYAYFPMDMSRCLRQHARWTGGIALQQLFTGGWSGSLRVKEVLLKDRKVVVTPLLYSLCSVFLLLNTCIVLSRWTQGLVPELTSIYPLKLQRVLIVAGFFVVKNAALRVILVTRMYGPIQGLLSLTRIATSSFIVAVSTQMAIINYLKSQRRSLGHYGEDRPETGSSQNGIKVSLQGVLAAVSSGICGLCGTKPVAYWDKTDHLEGSGIYPWVFVVNDAERPAELAIHRVTSFYRREILAGLGSLPAEVPAGLIGILTRRLERLRNSKDVAIRQALCVALGRLRYDFAFEMLKLLLEDADGRVRFAAFANIMEKDLDRRDQLRAVWSFTIKYGVENVARDSRSLSVAEAVASLLTDPAFDGYRRSTM